MSKMTNAQIQTSQDRMISADSSVNAQPISLKFCKGHFLVKSE